MEPADGAGEDSVPIQVARLEARRCLIRAIVEDHGWAHSEASVAIDGGNVWASYSVVLKALVEGFCAHGLYAFADQFADGIIHHGGHNSGAHADRKSTRLNSSHLGIS